MPALARDQVLDLGVGLGARRAPGRARSAPARAPAARAPRASSPADDLGRQRLRALPGAAELEHVEAVVVGLDDAPAASRPRAAGSRSAWRSPCAARLASWLTDDAAGAVDAARRAARARRDGALPARARASTTYDELWRWSVEDLEGFWALDLGPLRRRRARRHACSASREMPGARVVPGRARQLRRARCSAARTDDAVAIVPRGEVRERREWTWGELREQARARSPAGLRRAGRRARRPRRRLHAEHPRDRRRRSWPAPRSARSGRAARRTSARAA